MSVFKGMSINVTLSDEQMEQIACLTADKVNITRTHYMNETQVLQQEVQDLRREIKRRDDILISDILGDNSYKKYAEIVLKKNKALQKELDELRETIEKQ